MALASAPACRAPARANVASNARNTRIERASLVQSRRPRGARISTLIARASAPEGVDARKYFSPSKINLFLRVTARRPDGFHDLASLFHVIDLGDDMTLAKSSSETKDTLICSDASIPTDESNLVIKALNLFRKKTGIRQYFWVELIKKVPHGAGLGGGSGNAATTLFAANQLCGSPATEAAVPSPDPRIPSDEEAPWPNESLAAASDAAPPPLVSPGGEVDARWDSSTAKLSRGLNDRERARAPLPIAAARRPPDWPPRPVGHAPFRSARPVCFRAEARRNVLLRARET